MDSTQLGTLRNKLSKEIQELEDKLKERRDKIRAIDLVRGMLIEEAGVKPENKFTEEDGNRFRKMGLQEAVLNCMDEAIPRLWAVPEIKKELIAGGLKSKSKNLYSSVSATLQRLEKKGIIESSKTDKGRKRFKIKDKEATTPNPKPSGNA